MTNKSQLNVKVVSIAMNVLWTAVASFAILNFAPITDGLRVDNDAEIEGLDLTQHGESDYHKN